MPKGQLQISIPRRWFKLATICSAILTVAAIAYLVIDRPYYDDPITGIVVFSLVFVGCPFSTLILAAYWRTTEK